MIPTLQPQLLPAGEYLLDLIDAISTATTRVALVVTVFHNDSPRMEQFTQALCDAASRGVRVSFCVDSFTYMEPAASPWRHLLKDQSAQAYQAIRTERRLRAAGVKFRWLVRHANFGVMGRTHIKWSIVDNTVYSFGGVNLYEMGATNTDYMIKANEPGLADSFYERHRQLIAADKANHAGKNGYLTLDDQNRVIFDGGIAFHSAIYNRAVELAKQAKSIIFVSQYCPTGRLARALRGKNTQLYFNHWETASALNIFVIRAGMRSSKFQTLYTRDPYLHAKFIIYTMPNGSKIALTGSHNFQAGGVVLGTRELCLETTNPTLIAELEKFYRKSIR